MKTYTAGEDGGRLAEMAKAFGLEHQRRPRKQVREKSPIRSRPLYTRAMRRLVQDHSIEVAQMRAAYARQRHDNDEDHWHMDDVGVVLDLDKEHQLPSDMPSWMEEIEWEEENLHAHGVGGDLTSAVLGIIKGMVGPAILYLPHGLAKSGYAVAIPIMLLVTFLFLFSCECLLDCWRMEHVRLLRQLEEEHNNFRQSFSARSSPEEGSLLCQEENDTECTTLLGGSSGPSDDLSHQKRTFFLSYPELAYKAYGLWFEHLVKLGITLMQSCVCLVRCATNTLGFSVTL